MQPDHSFGPVRVYRGEKSGKYPDGNQVVVQGTERRAVFDSPRFANRIGEDFDSADLVIQGHMHEDHAAGLHRMMQAPVYIHNGDLAAIRSWEGFRRAYGYAEDVSLALRTEIEREFHYTPRPDAIGFDDGARWDLGGGVTVRAIHAPGHTAGHCVLLVNPGAIAFIGDIDLAGFGPYYGDQTSNLGDFRRTLAALPDLPAEVWITFHHKGVYTERAKFLQDLALFAGRIDEREQALLQVLARRPSTLEELTGTGLLYPEDFTASWVKDAERRTFAQHLEELEQAGRVKRDASGRYSVGPQ
jgi:glyoxylase-like metal-dependent hydrolase (beta-lactamase superfamily II)